MNSPGNLHLSRAASNIMTCLLYAGSIVYMYKTDLISRIIVANHKFAQNLESGHELFGVQKNWHQYFGLAWILLGILFFSLCIASIMSVFEDRREKGNREEFKRCLIFAIKILLIFGTLSAISASVAFSLFLY